MRRSLKILFFIVALFASIGAGVIFLLFCSNEHREYTYYASGKVKEEITFFSKKDKTTNQNYTILSYDEKGTIWAKTMVRYGYIDAVWLFHENGNIKHFAMYKRDTIHGIQKEYAADGKEIRESMYMNGEERYVTEIDMDKNNNTRYNYSSIFKEYLSLYGTLTYDNTNTIIDSLSFGCEIIGKDTIQENELYSLKIRSYMNGRDLPVSEWENTQMVMIEAMFDNYEDPKRYVDTIVKAENREINYIFEPVKLGYNYVGATVVFQSKEKEGQYFFWYVYKPFYVMDKNGK